MEKLIVVSSLLFLVADIFAITSLILPDWILTGAAGHMRLGLLQTCTVIGQRPEICMSTTVTPVWTIAFVCIVAGVVCLTITSCLTLASAWERHITKYARWAAFGAIVMLCLAALIFPIGFEAPEIGGEPYRLPTPVQPGAAYVLFVLSIIFTIASELFAGKVCLLPIFF